MPLVLYDQIGNGNSSHYKDASEGFSKSGVFIDQLDGLLLHLDIADNFDLLGHLWRGMVT